MKSFGAILVKCLLESKAEITPSPMTNSLYDGGLDDFSSGTKIYNNAMKSILASSEKMPKGEIKSIVQSEN